VQILVFQKAQCKGREEKREGKIREKGRNTNPEVSLHYLVFFKMILGDLM
jgi:hypothetical protein